MKLEQLQKKIQEVCPELMELSFGCEFLEKGTGRHLKYQCKWHNDTKVLATWSYDGDYGERITAEVGKILGHPITLEHVLKAVEKSPLTFTCSIFGDRMTMVFYDEEKYAHTAYWQLTLPLHKQSEDTINFLHEVICD